MSTVGKGADKLSSVSGIVAKGTVIVDVGMNAYDNIQKGEDGIDMASDAAVDASMYILSIMATEAMTGWTIGWFCPGAGNLAGALIGVTVGTILYVLTDALKINGKSLREYFKECTRAMNDKFVEVMTGIAEEVQCSFE